MYSSQVFLQQELIRYTQSKIESEEEVLERAKIMDELMDMADNEDDIVMLFANAISDRIEEFENKQLEWHRMKPSKVLANLMQIHQVEPKDLFKIAPQLVIAELLNEKQAMTLEQVKGFSQFFKVPVTLFVD
jgi:HTH-type transcriptional regulator/antitoxin HigA